MLMAPLAARIMSERRGRAIRGLLRGARGNAMVLVGRAHRRRLAGLVAGVRHALRAYRRARPVVGIHAAGTGGALLRRRTQLRAEHALLRQQVLVLRRGVARPAVTRADRALLVLLAVRVRAWREALLLVQPETLLRWHRAGFRARWRRKSRPGPGRPPLPPASVALVRQLADDNPRRGAERIRGEPGKRGVRVAKRTSQTSLRGHRAPRPRGQTWATLLRHHAHAIWADDFLSVSDLLFRPLYAFWVVELATRRVVHVGATRRPTDAWVAQLAARGHAVRPAPAVPDPRQRRRIRGRVRAGRRGQRYPHPAHAPARAAGACHLRAVPGARAP